MANFDKSDIQATRKVTNIIEQSTSRKGQQGTASEKEKKERADTLKTQGRKGCKAVRINMAFTPDNHDWLKSNAIATHCTVTEIVNAIISDYRRKHPELEKKARDYEEEMKKAGLYDILHQGEKGES